MLKRKLVVLVAGLALLFGLGVNLPAANAHNPSCSIRFGWVTTGYNKGDLILGSGTQSCAVKHAEYKITGELWRGPSSASMFMEKTLTVTCSGNRTGCAVTLGTIRDCVLDTDRLVVRAWVRDPGTSWHGLVSASSLYYGGC